MPAAKTNRGSMLVAAVAADTAMGNIGAGLDLSGPLDLDVLYKSYLAVLERHEALHTVVKPSGAEGEMPLLVVRPLSEQFQHFKVASAGSKEEAQAVGHAAWTAQYDLSTGPTMRLQVIRLSAERHWLVLCLHHVFADQMSTLLILRDLAALYSGMLQNQEPRLPHLQVHDLDYVSWIWDQEKAGVFERHQAFWQKQLSAPNSGEIVDSQGMGF